jgi:hypothetical protein
MAPVLIIGLYGRLVSFCRLIELKASPLGSTPTYRHTSSCPMSFNAMPKVKGFDTDCIVNGRSQSPTSNSSPSAVAMQTAKSFALAIQVSSRVKIGFHRQ